MGSSSLISGVAGLFVFRLVGHVWFFSSQVQLYTIRQTAIKLSGASREKNREVSQAPFFLYRWLDAMHISCIFSTHLR